jgi:hypothetical protein
VCRWRSPYHQRASGEKCVAIAGKQQQAGQQAAEEQLGAEIADRVTSTTVLSMAWLRCSCTRVITPWSNSWR